MGCDADTPLRLVRDSTPGVGSDGAGPQADSPMRSTELSNHRKHRDRTGWQERDALIPSDLSDCVRDAITKRADL